MRAGEGGAVVATVRATAAASLKAIFMLRSSSSPWPTTFPSLFFPSLLLISLMKRQRGRRGRRRCFARREGRCSCRFRRPKHGGKGSQGDGRVGRLVDGGGGYHVGRVFAAHVLLVVADGAGVDLVGSGAVRTKFVAPVIVITFAAGAVGDKGTDVLRSSSVVRPPTCRWRLETGRGATQSSLIWCASRSSLASFTARRPGRGPRRRRHVVAFTLYDCRAWREEMIGRTVVNGVRVENPTFSPWMRSQRREYKARHTPATK